MKYLLLLNNNAGEWERWRTLSREEAESARAHLVSDGYNPIVKK